MATSPAPSLPVPPERRSWAETAQLVLVMAAALAGLTYQAVRICQTIWFSQPYYGFTTGSEEEALYSLWKWRHGLPVYGDTFDIPYAASFFNWLFYAVYGTFGSLVLDTFGLNEAYLPTVARCITVALHAANVLLLVAIGRRLGLRCFIASRWRAWGYSLFALLNLCYSLWAITCRPDIAALFLELLGFWTVLRFEEKRRWPWLVAAVAILYAAWAFKQTSVSVVTAYCLFLLAQRRFADLLRIALPTFALYATTLAAGGPLYRYACVFSQSHMGFSAAVGLGHFLLAATKAPLLGVAVCLVPACLFRGFRTLAPQRRLLVGAFAVSTVFALATASKAGAYVNYFFLPAALGALCLAMLGEDGSGQRRARAVRWAVAGAALFQTMLVPQRLLHAEGTTVLQRQHRGALCLLARLPALPGPVLVCEPSLNLPWIQQKPPHFVFAFTYFGDRGRCEFRHGGMGGLIRDGFFGTIVLNQGSRAEFDGQPLTRYSRTGTDGVFDYYVRTP